MCVDLTSQMERGFCIVILKKEKKKKVVGLKNRVEIRSYVPQFELDLPCRLSKTHSNKLVG